MPEERCPKCGATEAEMWSIDLSTDPPEPYHAGKIDVTALSDTHRRSCCGRCGADLPVTDADALWRPDLTVAGS